MGEANKRIGFIITQQDVVFRLVLLDERIFKQECIKFGVNDGEFDFPNLLDQFSSFGVVVLNAGEIATYSVLEVFRFSYIDDGIEFVEIAIYSRLFGEGG